VSTCAAWIRLAWLRAAAAGAAVAFLVLAAWWLLTPPQDPSYRGRTVLQWAGDLDRPEPALRAHALEAFEAMGPPAVEALARRLRRADTPATRAYYRAQSGLNSAWRGAAIRLIKPYERASDRHVAATALARLGTNAMPALPALVGALRDPSSHVANAAAKTLENLGPVALPGLMEALVDPNVLTRAFAARSLGSLGFAASNAAPGLVGGLSDPNLDVRTACAAALHQVGPGAIVELRRALHAPAAETRVRAVVALAGFKRFAIGGLPEVATLFADPDPIVRQKALEAFSSIWGLTPRSTDALAANLDSSDAAVREKAEATLALLRGQAAPIVVVLKPLREHSDSEVRAAADAAMTVLGPAAGAGKSGLDTLPPPTQIAPP
jgi:hypothetical protein